MKIDYFHYKKICKYCDEILFQKVNDIIIANNSLNIIKEHPSQLKKFEKSSLADFFYRFIKYSCLNLIQLLINLNFKVKKNNNKKKKIKIILISHILNKDIDPFKKELYLGEIEKTLKKKSFSHIKILLNHTSKDNSFFNNFNIKKNIRLLPKKIDIKNEFFIIANMYKYFFKYLLKSISEKNNIKKKFMRSIAVDFLSPDTKKNLIIFKNLKSIFSDYEFKNLITTYEGFSWERLAFSACNKINIKAKRVGYQFAGFTKNQHSIFRKLNSKFDPDIIWTCGLITKKMLNKKTFSKKIYSIGTERSALTKFKKKKRSFKKLTCLVTPEGIQNECKILYNFAIDGAMKLPRVLFILRSHPIFNISKDFNNLKDSNKLPKNIIISNKPLMEDILRSDICLYRGSTSIITALQCGVYPLYLNLKNELNIDPLFSLNYWKSEINDLNDFNKFIEQSYFKKIDSSKSRLKAINFANNYFSNYSKINVLKSLN